MKRFLVRFAVAWAATTALVAGACLVMDADRALWVLGLVMSTTGALSVTSFESTLDGRKKR